MTSTTKMVLYFFTPTPMMNMYVKKLKKLGKLRLYRN
jgi:hypothetical protein